MKYSFLSLSRATCSHQALFSAVPWCSSCWWSADSKWNHLRHKTRFSMERRSAWVWAAQKTVQSIHTLESPWYFNKIFMELVEKHGTTERLMIDATHLKTHRTAASLLKKGFFLAVSDEQKAGWTPNFTLSATVKGSLCFFCCLQDKWAITREPRNFWTFFPRQKSYSQTGVMMPLGSAMHYLKKVSHPVFLLEKTRTIPTWYDKELYKQRHKIENMFGKIKDWRRIAMRYDRCAETFFSAICIAAVVIFYLN